MDISTLAGYSAPVILAAALVAAVTYCIVYWVKRDRWSKVQPLFTLPARIVRTDPPIRASKYSLVVFQTNDGQIREYGVLEPASTELTEGMSGALTFQGYDFVRFVPSQPPVTSQLPHEVL